MNRSTAALLIAILFHLVIVLLFWVLTMLVPRLEPAKPAEEERRIKVSLKERPAVTKEALVENKEKALSKAPPMPKGRQLKEIVKPLERYTPPTPPLEAPAPVNPVEPTPPEPVEVPKTAPLPPKEEHIPVEPTTPSPPSEHGKLYSLLSKPAASKSADQAKTPKERTSAINQDFKELYGDEFGKLSEGEQKYLLDNQEIMRRITQEVLNRVGRVNIPDNFRVNDYNIVEFYLHPNGDISDMKFIRRSGFYLLDDTTKETIEYAYSKYPRPEQKTLIRYRVWYYLQGY